jgi:von Willebrand factor type A domain
MVTRRIHQIPIRERDNNDQVENEAHNTVLRTGCAVSIHPLPTLEGLIVKVVPPTQPVDEHLNYVPCDIVLVIDVSKSMRALAPAPPREKGQEAEQTGLTVLDLAKHAANTIIETLNSRDRLAIVKFSEKCKVSNISFFS